MKTAELEGVLLGYWVARAEGKTPTLESRGWAWWSEPDEFFVLCSDYVEEWHAAGPIIERERIGIYFIDYENSWRAGFDMGAGDGNCIHADHDCMGSTPLIAAMRAFVCSVFGDEVQDIAKEY